MTTPAFAIVSDGFVIYGHRSDCKGFDGWGFGVLQSSIRPDLSE
jgi:hypothetical protein